jgi:CBS domain-containing protein
MKEEGIMSLECHCQTAVDVATSSESAFQAAERMHQRTVGTLVVVDNTNSPIGIVTDRDLTIRVVAAGRDPYSTTVRDVMTPSPVVIRPCSTISQALETMNDGQFRRLPIVNELGHLIGLVTLDDLVLRFAQELAQVGNLVESQMPRHAAETT